MRRGDLVGFAALCAASFALGMVGCSTTPEKTAVEEASGTGSEFDDGGGATMGQMSGMGGQLETIYFDYDRFEIRDDAKPALKTNAKLISEKGWSQVTIEGYCDERGSDEYNLALGERRASRVKSYLVDLGVPASKLRTVSFGEARPAVPGHDESAWRMNRRSEFTVGSR